jgi:Tfp pilus assembly protein PilF
VSSGSPRRRLGSGLFKLTRPGGKKLYDQATADFSKAIELKPNYAQAYNNRAWYYHMAGQDARA